MLSMSFSPPIWCHPTRTYYLGVFAQHLSRDMDQPIFPSGLAPGQFADNLYVKSSLLSGPSSFFYRLKFMLFSGAPIAWHTICFHQPPAIS